MSTRHRLAAVLLLTGSLSAAPLGQPAAPQPLQPEDYGRWEQLAAQRTPLSPDGRWLVYGITRSNRQNELRVQPSAGGPVTALPFGEQPAFSDDSRWLVWLIGVSEEQEAKLRKEKKPVRKQLGLLDLEAGTQTLVDGIESFSLSPTGTHIAMRRYAPEPSGAPAPADSGSGGETVSPGTTLVVRELATGRDTTFGSVSELAWQDKTARLALAVTVDGGVGNSVQLYDAATGSLRTLDSSASTYGGLAWQKDGPRLAVLRARTDTSHEGPAQDALVWANASDAADAPRVLDATGALGTALRVVRFRTPRWSDDGSYLFVGVGPWRSKPERQSLDGVSRRVAAASDNPDELPDVQVWHPTDTTVMARQKVDVQRERQRSMLAAWRVADDTLVRLAGKTGEEVTPMRRRARAVVVDTEAYAMDRSIGRVVADAWSVDLATGARSSVLTRIEDRYLQASPGGRYLLFLRGDHYWTLDLESGRETNLTARVATSFVDKDSDDTGAQKPAFGVAGWTSGDGSVLLYDRLDVWEVKPDGSGATRLTTGTTGEVRHRYVRLDPDEDFIDRSHPVYLSLFGVRSKKSGYARLDPGGAAATPLIFVDRRVDRLVKARAADRYAWIAQDFDDSPDYFAGGPDLASTTPVSATNPFMAEYAWGRSAIIEYTAAQGRPLQAGIFYPAGYQAGRTYPMVVYMYERLSDGVHQFSVPSERDYYNAAAFTSRGYVYLMPDIVFRPREPGLSVVESVLPAVQRAVQIGVADAARVGIIGHSWGGFDSAYLATHTTRFAAAVAGAPITNLVSNYGNHHWSSGIAETDHIETGQQRMQVPLYEDLQAYIRNSAVFTAHTMQTPLLIEVGDSDGTVFWHQGVELYNIARRAGRQVVLLQYGGEDHGLRKKANQIDYHHRIFEWFDHYLKGAPAAPWITSGERYLDRERDLQQRKLPAPKPATPTP